MTWVALGLLAGLLLGTYDFLTKLALHDRSVLAVIVLSSAVGALLWMPLLAVPNSAASVLRPLGLFPASLRWTEHCVLLLKSAMMVANWVLSYYAIKALPLSISAGVRASGPLWTAIGAIVFLGESLGWWQWAGLAVSMVAYYLFSLIGQKEGIRFHRNGWVLCMVGATILSSATALYDKHVVARLGMDLAAVQAWSAVQRGVIALILVPWVYREVSLSGLFTRLWVISILGTAYVAAEYIYRERPVCPP
ncbi:EamA family transporter [Pseudorhodoferax sp. Leaf274]|uniref:EamA family transporter n=1 Tax=Pseudorhodoferax sp. Leaf274 TaxID=1736318 RepID=UPI00070326EC|nr:EamA family transporter [Pseudorhodoferax sp. Leaf274]KQP49067.1 hypothetical protein ASF44_00020 [Pseudorhodoferax sp. Leaf274]